MSDPREEMLITEQGLQLATRFVALLRAGRAYPVDHPGFTQPLETFIEVLAPLLTDRSRVRLESRDGDVQLDDMRLPVRPHMQRSLEQLVMEFDGRGIAGIEFLSGLNAHELARFMEFFLQSERYKGHELVQAANGAGVQNVRVVAQGAAAHVREVHSPRTTPLIGLGTSAESWVAFHRTAEIMFASDALEQGIELRHLERLAAPWIEALIEGETVVAALAAIAPDESQGAHAAHTSLAAVATGVVLALPRRDLASVAIAALFHDAGQSWGANAPHEAVLTPASHTREGARRLAWATTFNPRSLEAMRAALEHHVPFGGLGGSAPQLRSQLVGIADAFVTMVAQGGPHRERLSPCGALARVLGPLRDAWHPAITGAFVEAVGLYPPGQVVELDDDTLARTLAPIKDQPERAWIEYLTDEQGRALPMRAREVLALPEGRRIAQALPRDQWPGASISAA